MSDRTEEEGKVKSRADAVMVLSEDVRGRVGAFLTNAMSQPKERILKRGYTAGRVH
jgi:hypothetical protein